VVWRNGHAKREFLILHRRYAGGIDFEGEWAWTPPAGAIEGGASHDAAKRELREETDRARTSTNEQK
jgi:8-oxo-dGTP pyrophosphatase MutT (NUDIX family)